MTNETTEREVGDALGGSRLEAVVRGDFRDMKFACSVRARGGNIVWLAYMTKGKPGDPGYVSADMAWKESALNEIRRQPFFAPNR